MDAQRGEHKSIIYGVFIWSFMLELNTLLKCWPDFVDASARQQKESIVKSLEGRRLRLTFTGAEPCCVW